MDQNTPQNIQNTESAPDMNTLTCKVEKIVFRNENNKYTVMSVIRDDGRHFRLLGNIDSVKENDALKATGSWNKDEKYGWQFKAETIEILSADAERDDREYLECKICEVRVLKAETGFASAKAKCPDNSTVKLSGRLANVGVGSIIRAYGKWMHNENITYRSGNIRKKANPPIWQKKSFHKLIRLILLFPIRLQLLLTMHSKDARIFFLSPFLIL